MWQPPGSPGGADPEPERTWQTPGGVLVLLVSGKQILAQAVSNSLGEFQMEHAASKRLRLYMLVRQAGKQIEVPLKQPVGRKTREGTAAAKKTPSPRKEH